MNVLVNNTSIELPDQSAISALLEQLKVPSLQGIAIAVNECVIAKSEWDNYVLNDRDEILLIRATQGG